MAEKKLFDVAHPGKAAPSATSRPVIVGHGPMMKDPMVQEQSQDASGGDKTKETKIAITHEKIVAVPDSEAAEPDPKPAIIAEDLKPEATKPDETDAEAETNQETKVETTETETEKTKPDEPEREQPAQPEPGKQPSDNEVDSSAAVVDAVAEPAAQKKKQAEEEKLALEQQAHIAELIEKKAYFVPINVSKHRRTSHYLLIIIMLLALVAAGAFYAKQTGLINL